MNSSIHSCFRQLRLVLGALTPLLLTMPAGARPEFRSLLPNDASCLTCHNNPDGGEGCDVPPCLNPFGMRFYENGLRWDEALANEDADGDGCTNGEEIGDSDGDHDIEVDDYCARSPGISSEGGSIPWAECFRKPGECCPPVERPREVCECGVENAGEPICRATTFEPNDLHENALRLLDGTWEEVHTATATNTGSDASCARAAQDVWFEYTSDCTSGMLTIELEDPATLVVYDGADVRSDSPSLEVACQARTTSLVVPTGHRLIRVIGGETRIRATCAPAPDSSDEMGQTCSTAIPLVDEVEFHVPGRIPWTPQDHPRDVCSSVLETDTWFSYEAPCTGTALVSLDFFAEDILNCTGTADYSFGVYHSTACPDRTSALLECDEGEHDPCFAFPIEKRIAVVAGESLLFRIGRDRAGLTFDGDVSVECVEEEADCETYCAPQAMCDASAEGITCSCSDLYRGDGILSSRGGNGCELWQPCVDAGLECQHGSCRAGATAFYCECDAGYTGYNCQYEENSCAPPTPLRGPGPGYVDCVSGRSRTTCIELHDGWTCGCKTGYSPTFGADEFDCSLLCGDGSVGPGEVCDDGNLATGDGCSPLCDVEQNWECWEIYDNRSTCFDACLDEFISEAEDCDGNGIPDVDEPNNCSFGLTPFTPTWPALMAILLPLFAFWRQRRRTE